MKPSEYRDYIAKTQITKFVEVPRIHLLVSSVACDVFSVTKFYPVFQVLSCKLILFKKSFLFTFSILLSTNRYSLIVLLFLSFPPKPTISFPHPIYGFRLFFAGLTPPPLIWYH